MGKLDIKTIQAKKEDLDQRMSRGGDWTFWTPSDGRNVVRVMPPKGKAKMFFEEVPMHFSLGPSGKAACTCLSHFDEDCPVCEVVNKWKKSKSEEDQKRAQDMSKKTRVYMNIVDRSDDEEKIQVASVGVMILSEILNIIVDPDYGDITDFEEGFDITITRSGKGRNTDYKVMPKRSQSVAVKKMDADELDEALPDLTAIAQQKSYDEVNRLMNGETDEDEDEDEGFKSRKSQRSKSDDEPDPWDKQKKPKKDDEDDDPPKRGRSKDNEEPKGDTLSRRGRSSDDDDGGGDDEEKPRKRGASRMTSDDLETKPRSRSRE